MKDNNPIDSYFRNSLKGHEVKASPEAWEKVMAGTESNNSRGAIWYLMRAAVVVLMFSVGTWYTLDYINSPQAQPQVVSTPVEEANGNEGGKSENQPAADSETKSEIRTEVDTEQKKQRMIPIMKQRQSRTPVYVSNEPMKEVDEQALYDHSEIELASIELDASQLSVYSTATPSMKLRLNSAGVTGERALAGQGTAADGGDLKTRLYAYANTQFDNIKNGRPLELPRTGKPSIQINLDKILDN